MTFRNHRESGIDTRPSDTDSNAELDVRVGQVDIAEAVKAFTMKPEFGHGWKAKTFIVPANGFVQIAGTNRQRKRLLITTTAAAYISPGQMDPATVTHDQAGAYALSTTYPEELKTTGGVWVCSVVGATIGVREEYGANVE